MAPAALVTSRLRLLPLKRSDAPELYVIRGDPQAMTYWDAPPDRDEDQTAQIVDELLRDVENGRAIYWTLRSRVADTFVGLCDLSEIRPGDSAALGFMITRPLWGQGLAYEACQVILVEARRLGLASLTARIHSGHNRSGRLLRRLGFQESGCAEIEVRPGVRRECTFFALRFSQRSA